MTAGRPTSLTKEVVEKSKEYLANYTTAIPSVAGLARAINVARATVYKWGEKLTDEEMDNLSEEILAYRKEFSDTLDDILTEQELVALNGGLLGDYNATITKLVLHNHGYSEKQEVKSDTYHQVAVVTDAVSDEEWEDKYSS